MTDQELETVMLLALTEPHGRKLQTSDNETFVRSFYRVRRAAREQGNFAYDELSLLRPANGLIYLVRKSENASGSRQVAL